MEKEIFGLQYLEELEETEEEILGCMAGEFTCTDDPIICINDVN